MLYWKIDMCGIIVCNQEKLNNEQLLCEIYDVRNKMIDLVYPFKQVPICMSESFLPLSYLFVFNVLCCCIQV